MHLKASLVSPATNIARCSFLGRLLYRPLPLKATPLKPLSLPTTAPTSPNALTDINSLRSFSSSTPWGDTGVAGHTFENHKFEGDGVADDSIGDWNEFKSHLTLTARSRRRRRPTPSAVLDYVLRKFGVHHPYNKSIPAWKVDLSYVNARTNIGSLRAKFRKHPSSRPDLPLHHLTPGEVPRIQTVLARFINHHHGRLQTIRNSTDYRLQSWEKQVLSNRGFDLSDVRIWAIALLLEDPYKATRALTSRRQPSFIILYFLKRRIIPLQCFERIIWYLWRLIPEASSIAANASDRDGEAQHKNLWLDMDDPETSSVKQIDLTYGDHNWSDYILESEEFFILAIVRLLRHARKISIRAQEQVRTLVVEVYGRVFKARAKVDPNPRRTAARLCFVFNKILTLFSLPTTVSPRNSALIQEKLQFDILHYMASHEPPLLISMEGYKALVRVQLAMPKTPNDRTWASLKAKTWPPWKEDKTGMDASITAEEFGISRANQILRWMQEAGYSKPYWHDSASILSGWDTDGSPTIQTRTSDGWLWNSVSGRQLQAKPWAARVAATRTVEEAWACFLAWEKDRSEFQDDVYHQMFKKLFASVVPEERYGLNFHLSNQELPGDSMIHVFPESQSPYQRTYVERPVPTAENLLKEMMSRSRVRPQGRFLALLLAFAPDIDFAMNVLRQANKLQLMSLQRFLSVNESSETHDPPPDYLLTAYISLLCKSLQSSDVQWQELTRSQLPATIKDMTPGSMKAQQVNHKTSHSSRIEIIVEALLSTQKHHKRISVWSKLFEHVFSHDIPISQFRDPEDFNSNFSGVLRTLPEVAAFRFQKQIVEKLRENHVEIEADLFQSLCYGAFLAGLSCAPYAHFDRTLRDFRRETALYLRGLFQTLTQAGEPASTNSRIYTPLRRILHPSVLHFYVRALGVLWDYEGLYSVICSMANEVGAGSGYLDDDQKTWRLVLVALRVYVERRWRKGSTLGSSREMSSTPDLHPKAAVLHELIRGKVESVSEWAGWPTDEEVAAYCEGHFRKSQWSSV